MRVLFGLVVLVYLSGFLEAGKFNPIKFCKSLGSKLQFKSLCSKTETSKNPEATESNTEINDNTNEVNLEDMNIEGQYEMPIENWYMNNEHGNDVSGQEPDEDIIPDTKYDDSDESSVKEKELKISFPSRTRKRNIIF